MVEIIQKGKLAIRERAIIARSLAALILTESSIGRPLANLAHEIKNSRLKSTLLIISEEVKESSIALSIRKREQLFGSLFIEMVKIGESLGTLPTMLIRLAEYYDQQQNFYYAIIRKIRPPLIVLIGSICALISVMIFLIPGIIDKITTSAVPVPSVTGIALKIIVFFQGAFIPGMVLLPIFFCIALAGFYLNWFPFFEKIIWHIPLIGALMRHFRLERFFSALSTAISTGIPEKKAIGLAALESKSRSIIQILHPEKNLSSTETMETMSGHLEENNIIPPLIKETIQATDSISETGAVLKKVAAFYQETILSLLSSALIILQPLAVVVTGLVILTLLIALYLPFLGTV
jgi:type II secretory pathway component PulF